MTAEKETAGNGEVWHSATTHWAALSSAATLCTSCAAATTASRHSKGDGGGEGEGGGISSFATARRNTNPVRVVDKDGIACDGRNGGVLRQR